MAFTPAEINAYFDRIKLPASVRELLKLGPGSKDALKAVGALQKYHLDAVPFENLDICYSKHKSIIQDLDVVYDQVVNKGRGGVCDTVHPLFARLLRSLGFDVYLTGARINGAAGIVQSALAPRNKVAYSAWIHLATIVTIGDVDYLVDTSHGPSGSPTPVPLLHDQPEIDQWPRQRRMMHQTLPQNNNRRQKWWCLQIKESPDHLWLDVWCFTETEWLESDYVLLRDGYARQGTGWVSAHVCCFKTLFEGPKPVGHKMILRDELRQWHKGKLEILQKFYCELDRIRCFEQVFGLHLTTEQQEAITDHESKIVGEDFDYY